MHDIFIRSEDLGFTSLGNRKATEFRGIKLGRLIPHEYECYFRSELRKRTPVDGSAPTEIFDFDPDGHTVGPCFNELRELVIENLPNWFERHNNLHVLLDQMNATIGAVRCAEIQQWGILALLMEHTEVSPRAPESAKNCQTNVQLRTVLNRLIGFGTILDFSTIQSGRPGKKPTHSKSANYGIVSASTVRLHIARPALREAL